MPGKRIFTVTTFASATEDVLAHLGDLWQALLSNRVDRAFAERVMLAVTGVNACRYCSFFHTRSALLAGVTSSEIQAIAVREFDQVPPDQVVALVFAQHYAETGGHPDPEVWQRVVVAYGPDTTRDLMVWIRLISLANLWGNTFDALLSRTAGWPAAGSSLWQELAVVLGWVVTVPVCAARLPFRRQRALASVRYD